MSQLQQERTTVRPAQAETEKTDIPGAEARERAADVSADTADLLDDIDELLNELPQNLAQTFKQQGGQ